MLRVVLYMILATSLVAQDEREIVKRGSEIHVPSPDCWSHVQFDFYAKDKDGNKIQLQGILRGDQIYWKVGSVGSEQSVELPDGEYDIYLHMLGSKCIHFPWRIEVVTPQYLDWNS